MTFYRLSGKWCTCINTTSESVGSPDNTKDMTSFKLADDGKAVLKTRPLGNLTWTRQLGEETDDSALEGGALEAVVGMTTELGVVTGVGVASRLGAVLS